MSSTTSLLIRQYEIGPLNNFLYLLGDPSTKEMTMIDPAWDVPFLLAEAKKLGYRITQVFLTHAHPDHVNGLDEVQRDAAVTTYVSKHEAVFLTQHLRKLTPVEDKAKLKIGSIDVEVLHMPGHTPGCQGFLTQGRLFCGDTLFIDGCGRCDLPGGNPRTMFRSLHNVIKNLPDGTIVYPGHNYGGLPSDTIGNQKRTNPYLQARTEAEFLNERM